VKKTRMPAGVVKKMSLAVLVDESVTWEKDAKGMRRVLVPPAPETMKIIHDVVAGVTGFNPQRGDLLVIETLPFETTLEIEPPAVPGANPAAPLAKPAPLWQLNGKPVFIGGAVAAGGIAIGFLAAMLLRGRKRRKVAVTAAAELAAAAPDDLESQLAERDALQQKSDAQVLNSLKLAPVITKNAEVLAKHLRERITKEPDVSAQIPAHLDPRGGAMTARELTPWL
jgi:flagellar M-ring protein FliF